MTLKQFDTLYLQIQKVVDYTTKLNKKVDELVNQVKELQNKTLVVTTLDKDLEKLKVDVAALLDEKEA